MNISYNPEGNILGKAFYNLIQIFQEIDLNAK